MAARAAANGTAAQRLCSAGDDLPCADFALLAPLKRSSDYRAIRKRVADPKPIDAWQFNGAHYFLFSLRADDGRPDGVSQQVAMFQMRWDLDDPASALLVTPSDEGTAALVVNLRAPEQVHIVALGVS